MRILVTAASRHGATAEIAELLAERLAARGHERDLRPPEEVEDLHGIEAVVLGSAVYAGLWLKTARDAIDRLGPDLRLRPVWLFSSGPLGDPPQPHEEPDVAGLIAATGAIEHRTFPGALDLHKLQYSERLMVRAAHAPEGDFRDPAAVRQWAERIDAHLRAGPAPARQAAADGGEAAA